MYAFHAYAKQRHAFYPARTQRSSWDLKAAADLGGEIVTAEEESTGIEAFARWVGLDG